MRKGVVVLLALATLGLAVVVPASATPPTEVSGTWQSTARIGQVTFTPVGKTCLIEGDWGMAWDGDIAGTGTTHTRIVSHGPCFDKDGVPYPKGSFRENLHYRGTFEGTVQGQEGTFEFVQVVQFTPAEGGPPDAPDLDGDGQMTILSSAGGLEGLHGVMTVAGYRRGGSTTATYSGQIHLD